MGTGHHSGVCSGVSKTRGGKRPQRRSFLQLLANADGLPCKKCQTSAETCRGRANKVPSLPFSSPRSGGRDPWTAPGAEVSPLSLVKILQNAKNTKTTGVTNKAVVTDPRALFFSQVNLCTSLLVLLSHDHFVISHRWLWVSSHILMSHIHRVEKESRRMEQTTRRKNKRQQSPVWAKAGDADLSCPVCMNERRWCSLNYVFPSADQKPLRSSRTPGLWEFGASVFALEKKTVLHRIHKRTFLPKPASAVL